MTLKGAAGGVWLDTTKGAGRAQRIISGMARTETQKELIKKRAPKGKGEMRKMSSLKCG